MQAKLPTPRAMETVVTCTATRDEMIEIDGGGHAKENSKWCWNSYLCYGYANCENPYDVFDKP